MDGLVDISNMKKHIEVVAAVIYHHDKYLATQRGYGEFEGLWEFPGGKIEKDESHEVALKREVKEELGVDISVEKFICTTNYNYPSFCLTMHCYLCCITNGEIELREHKSARWLSSKHFSSIDWLPADKVVIDKITLDLISRP